jgi:hypothetical protein
MKMHELKPAKTHKVIIRFVTVRGVSMQGLSFPVRLETDRHVELIVPVTGEMVIFSKTEVE